MEVAVAGGNAGKNVPAFLLKLYNMVNDHSTDELIRWNATGDSFLVMRHEDFAKVLLPRYYKHNNFSSFVRQLNMYGFHKIPHIEDNAFSKTESQVWEFSNPNFHRDQPDLLCLVTRKKSGETGDKESLDYQTIMSEIHAIKRHQMTISQDLKRIQADNQALWQEQVDTRTRHSKHQETIDKILSFLGSVYGNQRQEDKSIRAKKRKLLLEHDSSDQIQLLDSIFDDDKTKETFDNMFKSASSSPNLRPLRQPTTEIGSSKAGQATGPTPIESRYTLPNFDARQQSASNPAHQHQIRNMNKMKHSPVPSASPPVSLPALVDRRTPTMPPTSVPSNLNASIPSANPSPTTNAPPRRSDIGVEPPLQQRPPQPQQQLQLQQQQGPSMSGQFISPTAAVQTSTNSLESTNPVDMQLASSLQNRILTNNSKAAEIEQDLALQDQNIEALASLLGLDPGQLDASNTDPDLMYDVNYNNFDDFLNPNASMAATPLSTNEFDAFGPLDNAADTSFDAFLKSTPVPNPRPTEGTEMPPPSTPSFLLGSGGPSGPGSNTAGSTAGSSTASLNGARITSADSTPSSTAGSVHEEEIEEIDMEKARGKKRKSSG